MRWAMLPHTGGLDGRTVRAARAFNNPVTLGFGNGVGKDGSSALFPFTEVGSYVYRLREPSAVGDVAALLGSVRLCPVCSDDGVVLDTIKRGEDDVDVRRNACRGVEETSNDAGLARRKGRSLVLRLYDSLGGRCRGRVLFGAVKVKRVFVCNVLEDDGVVLEMGCEGGESGVKFELRAFEVKTLRLELDE